MIKVYFMVWRVCCLEEWVIFGGVDDLCEYNVYGMIIYVGKIWGYY